jgi:transposase
MTKRKFLLTTEETNEIYRILRLAGSDPIYDRLRAVLYYASGYSLDEVTAMFGVGASTLMGWCRLYRRFGPEGLASRSRGGNNTRLDEAQLADLTRRLAQSTPRQVFGNGAGADGGQTWTVQDLYRALREWYGVTYRSPTSYYTLLRRYGPR